jgi:hypothetical protein
MFDSTLMHPCKSFCNAYFSNNGFLHKHNYFTVAPSTRNFVLAFFIINLSQDRFLTKYMNLEHDLILHFEIQKKNQTEFGC